MEVPVLTSGSSPIHNNPLYVIHLVCVISTIKTKQDCQIHNVFITELITVFSSLVSFISVSNITLFIIKKYYKILCEGNVSTGVKRLFECVVSFMKFMLIIKKLPIMI